MATLPQYEPNKNPDYKNNFVAKVYDKVRKEYRPIYVAPDATNTVRGAVYLSDDMDETMEQFTADRGITAATPAAVRKVHAETLTKLDKDTTDAQTVAGPVTFSSTITAPKGMDGNSSSTSKLAVGRKINVALGDKTYNTTFDGTQDVTISMTGLDASAFDHGTLPLSVIPAAAQERLKVVADQTARYALKNADVQKGDTVYQSDIKVMYMVIDDDQLSNENGYKEYEAATATKLGFDTVGSESVPIYLKDGVPTLATQVGLVKGVKGNIETEYRIGQVNLTPANIGAVNLTGDTMTGTLNGQSILPTKTDTYSLGNKNLEWLDGFFQRIYVGITTTTGDLEASEVDTESLVFTKDGGSNESPVNFSGEVVSSFSLGTIKCGDTIKTAIADKNITTAKLADGNVTYAKLSTDIGTVQVSETEPTEERVKIWVKP